MPPKLILLICIIAFAGCKKDQQQHLCEELTEAMVINDLATVKTIITDHINQLPSQEHTAENVHKLAASLSGQCASGDVLCYGCIKTLPEMSEIRLTFQSSGTTMHRIIDLSNTTVTNTKMMFVSMHE